MEIPELLLRRDELILIEIVDERSQIDACLGAVQPMIRSGLVTIESISVPRHDALVTG
jgi:PII-like signaling protein